MQLTEHVYKCLNKVAPIVSLYKEYSILAVNEKNIALLVSERFNNYLCLFPNINAEESFCYLIPGTQFVKFLRRQDDLRGISNLGDIAAEQYILYIQNIWKLPSAVISSDELKILFSKIKSLESDKLLVGVKDKQFFVEHSAKNRFLIPIDGNLEDFGFLYTKHVLLLINHFLRKVKDSTLRLAKTRLGILLRNDYIGVTVFEFLKPPEPRCIDFSVLTKYRDPTFQ